MFFVCCCLKSSDIVRFIFGWGDGFVAFIDVKEIRKIVQFFFVFPRKFVSLASNVFLVRFRGVFGTFQLDFEPFRANLKAVHGLNGRLRAHWIIVRHET